MIQAVAVFLILSLSVSLMYSFSEIFMPVRNFIAKIPYLRKPLLCPECSSFWMGVLTSLFFNPYADMFGSIISTAFAGLTTHLFAVFLYKIYSKLS